MQPKEIVDKMFADDNFSNWLGLEVDEVKEGYCKLHMIVRNEMLNGFKIAHGGIAYSMADSALAFASNSSGKQAMTITSSMNKIEKINEGDKLVAIAKETSLKYTLGFYKVNIKRGKTVVASFKGTVYRTSKDWIHNK